MTDELEQKFLAAIAANPNDAEARAVYADWLEERGDPRAEYLRLEALLYAGPARFVALMKQLDPRWLAAVTRRCDVVLVETGASKILLIKTVREITGLGLKDAKDLVEATLPTEVRSDLPVDEAREIAAKLSAAGARAVVLPHASAVDGYLKLRLPASLPEDLAQPLWITRVDPSRRIDAIKAVRECTGIGLKEAKELIDAVSRGDRRAVILRDSLERTAALAALLRATCDVEPG